MNKAGFSNPPCHGNVPLSTKSFRSVSLLVTEKLHSGQN